MRGTAESFATLRGMSALRTLLLAYTLVDVQIASNLPSRLAHLKLSRAIHFEDDALRHGTCGVRR